MSTDSRTTEQKLLDDLKNILKKTLEQNLVGVYLYGSLATGDFVDGLSDIDLLMVVKNSIDEELLSLVADLHSKFNTDHEGWSKRIDVAYMSETSFRTIKSQPYEVIVSDGDGGVEIVDAPEYYLIDWYKVQEHSMSLHGPDTDGFMPHITVDEFKNVIRNYMFTWTDKAKEANKRGLQAYIVVTMCRSMYAYRYGKHTSKRAGADWAMSEYPQWTNLISQSLAWSRNEVNEAVVDIDSHQQTQQFVKFVLGVLSK